jgi:hypothetical protein
MSARGPASRAEDPARAPPGQALHPPAGHPAERRGDSRDEQPPEENRRCGRLRIEPQRQVHEHPHSEGVQEVDRERVSRQGVEERGHARAVALQHDQHQPGDAQLLHVEERLLNRNGPDPFEPSAVRSASAAVVATATPISVARHRSTRRTRASTSWPSQKPTLYTPMKKTTVEAVKSTPVRGNSSGRQPRARTAPPLAPAPVIRTSSGVSAKRIRTTGSFPPQPLAHAPDHERKERRHRHVRQEHVGELAAEETRPAAAVKDGRDQRARDQGEVDGAAMDCHTGPAQPFIVPAIPPSARDY